MDNEILRVSKKAMETLLTDAKLIRFENVVVI